MVILSLKKGDMIEVEVQLSTFSKQTQIHDSMVRLDMVEHLFF